MRFRGKVSEWFYGIMIFTAVMLVPLIVRAFADEETFVLAVTAALFLLIELFCIPIVFYNFAELTEKDLRIAFGFLRCRILYDDIEEIRSTRDPASSLAASFDRICIRYQNGKTVMISLQEKQTFYKEMQKRKSDINIM